MTVTLESRVGITLDVFERVAWRGESVTIHPRALERAAGARRAFLRLLARPDVTVYGVTSGYGDRAGDRLDEDERIRQAPAAALRAATFGEPLPERIVRGIVLARLANLVDGHAAVGDGLLAAVASMLDGGVLPEVPALGNGGSGEILALAHLFGPLIESSELGEKEGLALINGSPCAAALAADAALAARRRLALAYDVLASSVEAYRSPLDAYDPDLDALWGDEYDARALEELRQRLDGTSKRRPYQGPVSYRVVPRVLGHVERAVAAAAEIAEVSLRSVTDNPTYLLPSADHPDGRVVSTGGYHNAAAPAALHQLAVCWAEICLLAERHVERLVFTAEGTLTDSDELLRLLPMLAVGYSEEARGEAQPVILPRGGPGQNDVTSPAFLAWGREQRAAACCDSALAVLAAAAAARLAGAALERRVEAIRAESQMVVAALTEGRAYGRELDALALGFRARVLGPAA